MRLPSVRQVSALLMAVLLITTMPGSAVAASDRTCEEAGAHLATDLVTAAPLLSFESAETVVEDCFELGLLDSGDGSSQSEIDAYKQGLGIADSVDNFEAPMDNRLADSKPVAYGEAKYTLVQSFNDGDSKSIAKADAKQSVDDYYSAIQLNVIKNWNTTVRQSEILHSSSVSSVTRSTGHLLAVPRLLTRPVGVRLSVLSRTPWRTAPPSTW